MRKKEKILSILLGFLSFFLVDTLVVNALSTDGLIVPSSAQFYDNNNGSLTAKSTDLINNGGNDMFFMSDVFKVVANSSGGAIGFYLNEPLMSGYAYSLTVSVGATGCGYTRLSTVNRIGIGGSLNSASSAYQNGGNATIQFSDYSVTGTKSVSYVFTANQKGQYIVIPFTMNSTCNDVYYFYGYNISSLGYANNLTQSQIQTIINNNFNNISTAVQDSENSIKESISDTEDSINNTINDTFQDCPDNLLANVNWSSGYNFDIDGNLVSSSSHYYTNDYYTISSNVTYSIINGSSSAQGYLLLYDKDKNFLDYWGVRDRSFTTIEDVAYFRISTLDKSVILYKGTDYSCKNKIDSTNEKLDDVNSSIKETNDTLNDDDTTDSTNKANEFFSGFTTETFGLTSIITAPLTLIGSITSSTCSPLSLDIPFLSKNNKLNLPCMSSIYKDNFGSFLTIYQTITFGIVAYWVCVRIFALVKEFKNPDEDRIEVLDL